jgi:putative ABC transport system permease protein
MYTLIKAFGKNFFKHRSTNLLSVGGLSLGMAIALLLGWWAINETKFDNFHKDSQKIYRICREGFINNETVRIGSLFGPMGKDVKDLFPHIEESVKLMH